MCMTFFKFKFSKECIGLKSIWFQFGRGWEWFFFHFYFFSNTLSWRECETRSGLHLLFIFQWSCKRRIRKALHVQSDTWLKHFSSLVPRYDTLPQTLTTGLFLPEIGSILSTKYPKWLKVVNLQFNSNGLEILLFLKCRKCLLYYSGW